MEQGRGQFEMNICKMLEHYICLNHMSIDFIKKILIDFIKEIVIDVIPQKQ